MNFLLIRTDVSDELREKASKKAIIELQNHIKDMEREERGLIKEIEYYYREFDESKFKRYASMLVKKLENELHQANKRIGGSVFKEWEDEVIEDREGQIWAWSIVYFHKGENGEVLSQREVKVFFAGRLWDIIRNVKTVLSELSAEFQKPGKFGMDMTLIFQPGENDI